MHFTKGLKGHRGQDGSNRAREGKRRGKKIREGSQDDTGYSPVPPPPFHSMAGLSLKSPSTLLCGMAVVTAFILFVRGASLSRSVRNTDCIY